VGRPGLDPGTSGLKGTCGWLLCVGLVAYVFGFQGNVLFLASLVSWCCTNMRPKMRPVRIKQFAICSASFKIGLLRFECGFTSGLRHRVVRCWLFLRGINCEDQ